mmetsp:Transcript_10392/g.19130  ORF Transcript_10392/g.19130 Transcript_10392/m.19130 type:complete len:98 (-) Transcript_10392:242-535(-)
MCIQDGVSQASLRQGPLKFQLRQRDQAKKSGVVPRLHHSGMEGALCPMLRLQPEGLESRKSHFGDGLIITKNIKRFINGNVRYIILKGLRIGLAHFK